MTNFYAKYVNQLISGLISVIVMAVWRTWTQ